jgi:glutamate formiminotransferase
MGVYLASRSRAQVSMNLVDFRRTSLLRVLEQVRAEAAALGARVVEGELIGLMPEEAAHGAVRDALQLTKGPALIEDRLRMTSWTTP